MKKIFFIILVVFIIANCNSNLNKYDKKKKEGYTIIENAIKKPKLKKLNLISKKKYKKNNLLYNWEINNLGNYFHYKKKGNKTFFIIRNKKHELIAQKRKIEGKGPGEVLWIASNLMNNNKIYYVDGYKQSVEIFNYKDRFKYIDTLLINDFQVYSGTTQFMKSSNSYYFAGVMPYLLVKLNENFKVVKKVKPKNKTRKELTTYNLCRTDFDSEKNIYLVFTGKKNKLEIRKYNKNLELIWINKIFDSNNKKLSPEMFTYKGDDGGKHFQMGGSMNANAIELYEGNLYLLRAAGGNKTYKKTDEKLIKNTYKIKDIKNPYIDVYDSQNGKFIYRISCDFLKTNLNYKMKIINDLFYFASQPNFDNKKLQKGSNQILKAKLNI